MASSKHVVVRPPNDAMAPVEEWEDIGKTALDPDTPIEQRFLLRLGDQPNDLEMRAVFADWLDERGQRDKAELLRLVSGAQPPDAARVAALARQVDPVWRAIVSRAAIDRCDARFAFRCPLRWESLASTDDARVRRCGTCQREVYFCTDLDEVQLRGRRGDCVALCASLPRERALEEYDGDFVEMGELSYDEA